VPQVSLLRPGILLVEAHQVPCDNSRAKPAAPHNLKTASVSVGGCAQRPSGSAKLHNLRPNVDRSLPQCPNTDLLV
jgi:hypothetical protein